jgi:hypothetical protein
MPRGFSDLVEVVVFTAGAHAFLRRRGAHVVTFLDAEKSVFKLVHAGVGKQQRRIVGRQQRRRTHRRVPVFFKILEKSFANFVTRHHIDSSLASIRIIRVLRRRSHFLAYKIKSKPLPQQVIEQLFCFRPVLRPAAQTDPLVDCAIDKLLFRRLAVDKLERFGRNLVLNLLDL